uniref:Glycosyltransferase n=1 Tax=Aegilops tauschii TaxID=37682 RepID=M8CPR3_AEGTA
MAALLSTTEALVPPFRSLVSGLLPPASCVISDVEHILYASKDMGLPCVPFWTSSAFAFMACQQCQRLVDMGIVPLKGAEQLRNGHLDDTVLDWVPGMPKDIRLRDFPSLIRTTDPDDAMLKMLLRSMACHRTTPSAVIFHTFDEIDREAMAAMSTILPPIYAVGPLPLLLDQVAGNGSDSAVDTLESNLSRENHACLEWLNGKRPNSVLYVSFGSVATLKSDQLVEFAWGLANSKKDFLWVIRNDQVINGDDDPAAAAVLPPEFLEETKARSHVTSWCPQEAVLRHEATGAFLTHCGWNSVLESIGAGVPMLCWPFGADQYTNARYVCSEWRVGIEIGGDVKRDEGTTWRRPAGRLLEAASGEVIDGGDKGEEMKRMAMQWKEKATAAALTGGPSWVNLEKVVDEVLVVHPSKISDTEL